MTGPPRATDTGLRIDPPAWMRDRATVAVMGALRGGGAQARFVGGCIRNTLLGCPVSDIDIATSLPPEEVTERLETAGLKAVPTGLKHGTITAVAAGKPFEITTLRVDVATDGRHAQVAFVDDWCADAARRDFTMNAMSADPDGTVHDYFGGVEDARERRVRFVGDAARRIEEDHLRLLRFFRFLAHYGRLPADADGLAACRAYASRLDALSGERVRDEILKLLAAPDPVPVWRLMVETGVAVHAIGVDGDVALLAGLVTVEASPDPLRRLAALLGGPTGARQAPQPRRLAERLRLANRDRDRLLAMTEDGQAPTPAADAPAVRRLVHCRGAETATDLIMLAWGADPGDARFAAQLAVVRDRPPPRFPLRGADVRSLGVPAGPAVGRLLRELESWWIDGDFQAGRRACLAELRRRAGLASPLAS